MIFDSEDIAQMKALYELLGVAEQEAEKRIEYLINKSTKQGYSMKKYPSPSLKTILFPESLDLIRLKTYDRYLAWLIFHNGMKNTAKILNISRMSLNRYLRDL
jgi:hypothetical protein